jgi:hypothetical protein
MGTSTDQSYCELRFPPNPELVPVLHRFVASFCTKTMKRSEDASRVALAARELVENVVKYCAAGEASVCLRVVAAGVETQAVISTKNFAHPEHVRELCSLLTEMQQTESVFEYYRARMRSSASGSERSGFGLARIGAEAEVDLSAEADDTGLVVLTARTRIASSKDC